MGIAISMVSGKGGVGKTTLTAYIGMALSELNQKVLLIDENLGLRNLDLLLGLENDVILTFSDILSGKYTVEECIIPHPEFKNLSLLSCSQTKSLSSISHEEMTHLITELKEQYDYIFIDTASGIEAGLSLGLAACDETIVITDLTILSLRNTDQLIQLIRRAGIRSNKIILNLIEKEKIQAKHALDYMSFSEIIYDPVIGVIDTIPEIPDVVFQGISPSRLKEQTLLIFYEIALRITGESTELPDISSISVQQPMDVSPEAAVLSSIEENKKNLNIFERIRNRFRSH